MRTLIDQIERSLSVDLYFLSLFGAVVIPDVAGALDTDGFASGKKYEDWFDNWVVSAYADVVIKEMDFPEELVKTFRGNLTGKDCYQFRCSLLHQGRSFHQNGRFDRIMFVHPNFPSNFHDNISEKVLNLDMRLFCQQMILGTRRWLDTVESTPKYEQNYANFVRYYPNGLSPHFVGWPLIG